MATVSALDLTLEACDAPDAFVAAPMPAGSNPVEFPGGPGLPDFASAPGFVAARIVADWPEAPAYLPTREEEAWSLGFALEAEGERAMIRTIDGYTASEHLAFANGQRAARSGRRPEPAAAPWTHEMLADALRATAAHCEAQGGPLGAFLGAFLRDGAADVAYYRAKDWAEFSARQAEMIETLQDCSECRRQAYADRM